MNGSDSQIHLGPGLYIDVKLEAVVRDGMVYSLSRLQFRLLHYLAKHLNIPVSTDDLIHEVWGHHLVSRDELYVYVSRVKRIVEKNPATPDYLLTVRGYGYILRADTQPKENI